MSKNTFSYLIVPGWAENRWKTSLLEDELNKTGGQRVHDPKAADIVIAHSAGAHLIPDNLDLKALVLIGPVYHPNKALAFRTIQEYSVDTIYHFRKKLIYPWLLKNIYYIFFGLRHPRRSFHIYRELHKTLPLHLLREYRVLLIRNEHDYFCSPDIAELAAGHKNIRLVSLPGHHDDCWQNPKPYVDLILKQL